MLSATELRTLIQGRVPTFLEKHCTDECRWKLISKGTSSTGREAQGSAAQPIKQILFKGTLVFLGGGFPKNF